MASAASTFLTSANAANAALAGASGGAAPIDTARVLTAIANPQVVDTRTLLAQLQAQPEIVDPVLDSLAREGLIVRSDSQLKLSEAGERAVRYLGLVGR